MITDYHLVLTANSADPVDFMQVPKGLHRIDLDFGSTTTGTATVWAKNNNDDQKYAIEDEAGDQRAYTASGAFEINGPILIGIQVASLVNGPIHVHKTKL